MIYGDLIDLSEITPSASASEPKFRTERCCRLLMSPRTGVTAVTRRMSTAQHPTASAFALADVTQVALCLPTNTPRRNRSSAARTPSHVLRRFARAQHSERSRSLSLPCHWHRAKHVGHRCVSIPRTKMSLFDASNPNRHHAACRPRPIAMHGMQRITTSYSPVG